MVGFLRITSRRNNTDTSGGTKRWRVVVLTIPVVLACASIISTLSSRTTTTSPSSVLLSWDQMTMMMMMTASTTNISAWMVDYDTALTLPTSLSSVLSLVSSTSPSSSSSASSSSSSKRRHGDVPHHEPLNVVLFYADDWTASALGKLDPNIHTPNLDRMADNGMIFTSNFVTTSICFVSRATLLTGVYAAVHNQTRIKWEEIYKNLPWNETLFPLMRSTASYHTGLVGKWHLSAPRKEMDMAFDVRKFYYGRHWVQQPVGPPRHVTDLNREDAIHFLRNRPRDKKFLLKVSFFATHAVDGAYPSYQPKNETLNTHYANATIPPPKTATNEHWERLPHFFTNSSEGRKRWQRRFEPDYFQESIRSLYSMATEVDAAVGAVIDELKDQGIYNHTIIIFTTDNGNLHGQHGLAEKWYPFEESILVPLIVQDPRMPLHKRGTVSTDFTLSIDLAPTILGAANITPPSFMQGSDIAQLYLNDDDDGLATTTTTTPWRKDFFYEYNRGNHTTGEGHDQRHHIDNSFALVTPEWKYIYWPQHDYEQIFHRSMDPYDEYDLLHMNLSSKIQPTDEIYNALKERYHHLKYRAQSGGRV